MRVREASARVHVGARLAIVVAMVGLSACKKDGAEPVAMLTSTQLEKADAPPEISSSKKLAAIAMQANVYAAPNDSAKKIGYLRLGAVVPRSERSHGNTGCPGGWYAVAPRGFVCIGKTATLDLEAPIVRAANVRPDTSRPLPYAYGFVRAVSPLYLRPPTSDEATGAEFKLSEHLDWYGRKGKAANHIDHLGANDLAHEIFKTAKVPPPSDTLPDGVLLGGATDAEPLPFWLAGGTRAIPNVSGFEVPAASIFANRLKRHTGLAFVGTFASGLAGGNRQYAVTVDMRLVPVDKLKPEVASAFHGVELTEGGLSLPLAFAKPCNPNAKGTPRPCVHTFTDNDGRLVRDGEALPTRGMLQLSGNQKKVGATRYLQTKTGTWVRASDVGVAVVPVEWPQAAERGEKWVDVSVEDQTLILWEGKKPVYATVVSTGQDGLGDPKTSKSTPRGTYRIKSKHITATMDSNGRGAQSGGAAPESGESSSPTDDDKHAGNFELRDVPYVQYFQDGFALHSAYWHDHFGLARSHGCINLAPIDALRVFGFTDPPIPEGWHGTAVESGKGTMVVIHR
jgi:lipoprotein-anchoring transpeptidase ErfK/SrfK